MPPRLDLTWPAGELSAATSVGLRPGRPLVATRVVGLPHLQDVTMTEAPSRALPRRVALVTLWRRRLLDDLRRAAVQIGAAGVCAIRFGQRDLGEVDEFSGRRMFELSAYGVPLTPSSGGRAAPYVFRTSLAASELATLLRAGWMTADVLVSGRSEVRRWQHRSADAAVVTGRANAEIVGATHIVTAARSAVRADLTRQARSLGADGLLAARFTTQWSSTRHVVEVAATAEAVVRWKRVRPDAPWRTTVHTLGVPLKGAQGPAVDRYDESGEVRRRR